MTRLRHLLSGIGVMTLIGAAWAQVPETMDDAAIPKYRVVRPGLATGGKPSAEALERLKAQGFKTVVDLRTEAEGTTTEKETVETQGLRYLSVPISPASFGAADVEAVAKVLKDKDAAPVLLHCSSANRVGAVWMVMQVQEGRSLEEAEAAGKEIGLSSQAMVEAARRVAASLPR
jgi:uncharacterized protein (TIGR01244 family)